MNKYNRFFESHFHGCTLLATQSDVFRNRVMKIYHMPGYDDVVGIWDGVDAWVGNATAVCKDLNLPALIKKLLETGKRARVPLTNDNKRERHELHTNVPRTRRGLYS